MTHSESVEASAPPKFAMQPEQKSPEDGAAETLSDSAADGGAIFKFGGRDADD